jgi:2-polyprenyl-3-methyl-5-hydroxy-6-metoxy-1,4-benzoquinol methylase
LNSREFFESYYQKNSEQNYAPSLKYFFESVVREKLPHQALRILDLGCGSYSLFEETKNLTAEITAIDFSTTAIAHAPKSQINYKNISATDSTFFKNDSYHLIFDSHCMNCLTNEEERNTAFKNIHRALNSEGLFASEMMVQPVGKHISMPLKFIRSAYELEQELLQHNFKIFYFMIVNGMNFVNEFDGKEISCDVLRIVAKKN